MISFNNCIEKLTEFFDGENEKINSFLLHESPKRRRLFTIFENFIQLEWHQNKFTLLKHPLICRISLEIFNFAGEIQFTNDKIWFAGTSNVKISNLAPNSSIHSSFDSPKFVENIRSNSIIYFSIGIILLGLAEEEIIFYNISKEQINIFFNRLELLFSSSPNIFVYFLMENDERCLLTFIAIIKLHSLGQNKILHPKMLDPELIFIVLLRKINFDSLVIIDWAYSEPELCFLLLKSFTHYFSKFNFQQFEITFQRLKDHHLQQSSNLLIHRIQESPSSTSNNNLTNFKFDIEELHGEKLNSKQIIISTRPKYSILEKSEDDFELQYNFEIFQNSFISFCEELIIKLKQLGRALNFPSEKICQNLFSIKSIILNENE
uniref:Uncharacterized protein n=1 Tax=Meloidogyne floridensis TaxID=298350 RepID=A0A915NVD6_9BILA